MIQVMAPQDKYRSYAWVASNYEEAVDETTSTDYATYPEMVEFWGKLEGYWNAGDNRFIHFTLDAEGNPQMYCGIWYAGGGRGYGTLEKAMSSAKGDVVTFAMWYPGLDEDHMDGPMPEMNQVVSINMTEHRYMMLQVKLDDGPWEYYYWGGFEAEDAMP